jgi:hypothetical protein
VTAASRSLTSTSQASAMAVSDDTISAACAFRTAPIKAMSSRHAGACGYSRSASSSRTQSYCGSSYLRRAGRGASCTKALQAIPAVFSHGILVGPCAICRTSQPRRPAVSGRGLRRRAIADGVGRARLQLQAHLPFQFMQSFERRSACLVRRVPCVRGGQPPRLP